MHTRCCLVTGGAGFIGSHLVQGLLDEGSSVKVLDRPQIDYSSLAKVSERIQIIEGDFANRHIARIALEGADTLFHCASTTLPATADGHSIADVTENLVGTLNLLDEASLRGCKRLIFPSSGGTVYGPVTQTPIPESHSTHPICSHGIVKLAIEKYIHLMSIERGLKYTILRYSNPFGPRQRSINVQGAVAVFTHRILTRQPIDIWGDGSAVRDYLYIDDLVRGTLMASSSENAVNQIFNIGSGVGVSVKELLSLIEKTLNVSAMVNFFNARHFDVPINVLAIDKARSCLGWSPSLSLQDGLRKTIERLTLPDSAQLAV
jgi:UDP-glucose 4-epimerase